VFVLNGRLLPVPATRRIEVVSEISPKTAKKRFSTLSIILIPSPECYKILLWDKIARPRKKPFGLFYPLETCFSAESFNP